MLSKKHKKSKKGKKIKLKKVRFDDELHEDGTSPIVNMDTDQADGMSLSDCLLCVI